MNAELNWCAYACTTKKSAYTVKFCNTKKKVQGFRRKQQKKNNVCSVQVAIVTKLCGSKINRKKPDVMFKIENC